MNKKSLSLALGLDFSPEFERIRREFTPIEINQIADPTHPPIGVEYLDFGSLGELVEYLKEFKVKSSKLKVVTQKIQDDSGLDSRLRGNDGEKRIIFLTKQTTVVEKFLVDNDIEAEVYQWKLGGPSFTLQNNKEEIINNKEIPNSNRTHFLKGDVELARQGDLGINKSSAPPTAGQLLQEGAPNICVITDELLGPLLGGIFRRKKKPQLDLLVQIRAGDPVVHIFHGVGIFRGIVHNTLSGVEREYIEIEYAEGDKLFVPVDELHRVSKFVGESLPTLTRLGSPTWQHILAKTNEEIQKIAEELLANHAARRIAGGVSMRDFPDKEETFHIAFPFKHTTDQEQAIQAIMADMSAEEPMDRLLSGDVGFGKTEVSLHAVYRAFLNHKQTIFLAPLVVLAYEHFESIQERLKPFGVKVALLTRMSSTKEEKEVLLGLKNGTIHCIVGTHRLLSPDIHFADLGLVVVDEEHKFGVTDKEKILHLKAGVDTLALSATPIPRSLNLALAGVKHFSILGVPPVGKKPIHTAVARYDTTIVKRAIEEELARGGKVFFVHNTIETLPIIQKEIEKLIPKAKVVITHGQLPSDQLEDRIMEFKLGILGHEDEERYKKNSSSVSVTPAKAGVHLGKSGMDSTSRSSIPKETRLAGMTGNGYNVLLTTTVIENGINFFDTNTIIIDEAEDFGLAQLHQLRGRVGRGSIQGICYLLYRNAELADDARERLMTIANHTYLGAGFEIALRDMEIRGVGDVLGVRQSGRTKDVGVSFYLKLLEQKIEELQAGPKKPTQTDTIIDIPVSAFIPDEAFSSDIEKIHFYRELESVRDVEELQELAELLLDRPTCLNTKDNLAYRQAGVQNTKLGSQTGSTFCPLYFVFCPSVANLFLLIHARIRLATLGIRRVHLQLGKYTLEWGGEGKNTLDAMKLILSHDTKKCGEVLTGKKIAFPKKAFRMHGEFLEFLSKVYAS